MSEKEALKSPEQANFEVFKQKYLQVLKDSDIPDMQKVLLRQPDYLMVMGKLKPMTEITLQKDIIEEWEQKGYWQENSAKDFLQVLEDNFDLHNIEEYTEEKHAVYRIFDPEQIKEQIKKFPKLLPWNETSNIKAWVDQNLKANVPIDYIYGALYGFPKSAIEFMLDKGSLMDVEFQGINNYGEDYGVPPGDLATDVIARENAKKNFFNMYDNDQEIQSELKKTEEFYNELMKIRNKKLAELDKKDERLKK